MGHPEALTSRQLNVTPEVQPRNVDILIRRVDNSYSDNRNRHDNNSQRKDNH
jgi:hypothetical protein